MSTSAATTSSKDTPMGWPVKPLVFRISRCLKSSPNTLRSPYNCTQQSHNNKVWVKVSIISGMYYVSRMEDKFNFLRKQVKQIVGKTAYI